MNPGHEGTYELHLSSSSFNLQSKRSRTAANEEKNAQLNRDDTICIKKSRRWQSHLMKIEVKANQKLFSASSIAGYLMLSPFFCCYIKNHSRAPKTHQFGEKSPSSFFSSVCISSYLINSSF
ncbi:unnamed protein product [Cuscuta epithymum]|uniref:Uncharacterized protein n=1 Tax=Cuscuta epithymum TaxID=186058 RepID=A0AAV0FE15_9ASTE|nr:unnamed protein product [Cuscuta epithymum]